MDYNEWKETYDIIARDLQLETTKDENAAELLDDLIDTYQQHYVSCDTLESLIKNNCVFVFGAAPSLKQEITKNRHTFEKNVLIASDGATSCLLSYDLIPDVIVTDLDGIISDQLYANTKNAILVVHAHGDNMEMIKKTIPAIKGPYLGTIQCNPSNHRFVRNFGGFTDGDRAVFLAAHFHAKDIILVGFDCHENPGFYSFQGTRDQKKKRMKLLWCERLLKRFPRSYVRHI